jgi:hypothetical protein
VWAVPLLPGAVMNPSLSLLERRNDMINAVKDLQLTVLTRASRMDALSIIVAVLSGVSPNNAAN